MYDKLDIQTRNHLLERYIRNLESHPTDDYRIRAAEELGKIGDERAIPHLVNALSDENGLVLTYILETLEGFGPAAVPELIKAARDAKPQSILNIIFCLGNIGDDRAKDVLKEKCQDQEGMVRTYAASALGQIGDYSEIGIIISSMGKCIIESDHFGRALEKSGKTMVPFLLDALVDPEKQWDAYGALVRIGGYDLGTVRMKLRESLKKGGNESTCMDVYVGLAESVETKKLEIPTIKRKRKMFRVACNGN